MAYTSFTNCTQEQYNNIIYSGDSQHRIRIWFNNVELQDADEYCEKLSGTNRIFPNDGAKRISLDNFVAKEYNLILRNLPQETIIADQVRISIGTLVDEENQIYEDVPIGIFNIQDKPETDKEKITIKLRDNRVKFDFGYNAKPLIDNNGGTATYMQILNDICTQAGVTSDVNSFAGQNIAVGIYDNTITATAYVSYIAEQAGAIPVITREGHLNFIYLNNLTTCKIPLSIVEKYEIGKEFQIKRVVYESGTIKYQTSSDKTLETLFLDANNMYISSQAQVNAVFNLLSNVTIGTGKTGKIIGNPAIDAWDLIQIYGYYDENDDFVDDQNTIVFTTLANNTYTYNGVNINTFDTQIGEEERKENVTITGEGVFRKWAKSEIDNVNGTLTNVAGDIEDITIALEGYYALTEDATFEENKDYYTLDNNGEYIYYPQYYTTGDTTYQSGVNYYSYDNNENTYTLLVAGTDYQIGANIEGDIYNRNYATGDSITANTYYELIQNNALERRMNVAEETLSAQGLVLTVKTSKIDNEGNSTSFISEGANYVLTEDSTFQEDKTYYIIDNGEYVVATVTVGSSIPSNTYYEQNTIDTIRYELGKNGFITDDGNGFKAIRDSKGDFYYENDTMIGKYTKDGSVQKDMALFGRYYYGVEQDVDVEHFTKDNAMFMAEMYEGDDGNGNPEKGFGHFWNGS